MIFLFDMEFIKNKNDRNNYITFNVDNPISSISLKDFLIYRYALLCVKFKNWWFDNYFNVPLKKRSYKTKLMFLIGQIVIHKINRRYSFCVFYKNTK